MNLRLPAMPRSTLSWTFFIEANISTSWSFTFGDSSTADDTTFDPSRIRMKRSSLLPFIANCTRSPTVSREIFCNGDKRRPFLLSLWCAPSPTAANEVRRLQPARPPARVQARPRAESFFPSSAAISSACSATNCATCALGFVGRDFLRLHRWSICSSAVADLLRLRRHQHRVRFQRVQHVRRRLGARARQQQLHRFRRLFLRHLQQRGLRNRGIVEQRPASAAGAGCFRK